MLGSKIVNRQRNGLIQRSCEAQGANGEANEVTSVTESQLLPSASLDLSIFSTPASVSFQNQISPDPNTDSHFIVMHSMRTWEAFICIANILKLACMQESGFNIEALAETLPPPLAPTSQQQIIPHRPYVDMLPWSSLRDRVLNSIMTINEVEFVQDMYDMKVWGSTPWDPMGWEVSPAFARKWWFLMDDGVMRTTNFWRSQRGEEPLVVAPL